MQTQVRKSPEEIIALFNHWKANPFFDLEDADGFEADRAVLIGLRLEQERKWAEGKLRVVSLQRSSVETFTATITARVGPDGDQIELVLLVCAKSDLDDGVDIHSCVLTQDVCTDGVRYYREGERYDGLSQEQIRDLERALAASPCVLAE